MRYPRCPLLPAAALLAAATLAVPALAQTAPPVELRILAINDFHGYLQPPPGGIAIADPPDQTKKTVVPAGGSERMARATATPSSSPPAI